MNTPSFVSLLRSSLSQANSTINLLNIKLKHHSGENHWLRSRVNDLEVMVKTMKVAMEGSLEDGAAEKEVRLA